ncbi:MAG: GNAT family N-acetyltransferase [Bacteroides sp.]|nr:GNAT family N-acetyltransferase [Bacteroides sp.]
MSKLHIELYTPGYQTDFVRLNSEWIRTYFRPESSDYEVFSDPEGKIIGPGGQIFLAVDEQGTCIGCCALIRHEAATFELAKMAVAPESQGSGAGRLLGEAALAYARAQGATKVFLEGNTRLEASIRLYRKLGFTEVPLGEVVYDRCNIKMEMDWKR